MRMPNVADQLKEMVATLQVRTTMEVLFSKLTSTAGMRL
jgi:hypothetical protein